MRVKFEPIYDMIKVQLLNKNRQQIYIRDVMFKDWKYLQQEGAIVDHLHQQDIHGNEMNNVGSLPSSSSSSSVAYISNYVVYVTSRLMEQYISVGIEVELFNGGWHLLSAYWYLDFLASAQLNLLVSMSEKNNNSSDMSDNAGGTGNGRGTGSGNGTGTAGTGLGTRSGTGAGSGRVCGI